MRNMWMLPALVIAAPAMAQTDPDTVDGVKAELAASYAITGALLDSAEGWNGGDIDRFLAVYADNAAFTTSEGVAHGKAGIRARYLLTYASQFGGYRSAPPTVLSFTFEDFRLLGPDYALQIARWKLVTHSDEAHARTGLTTLVFHNEAGKWKIIADHSS